jgi:cation diffusion facilitator family transporter
LLHNHVVHPAAAGRFVVRSVVKFALGSIAVGAAALVLKFVGAHVSRSAALYSDALESLVNVAASLLALYALVAGAKPADRQHPYGHAKVELLSAVATGGIVAAVLILERAWLVFHHLAPLAPLSGGLGAGLVLNGAAGVLNLVWAIALRRISRVAKSPALLADSQHLSTDVLTSIGIIVALVLAQTLGRPILDPVIAVVIALQIAIMGMITVFRSLSGLLDEAPPAAIRARIEDLVRQNASGALEAHDFRTRQAGPASFLEFHLVVPGCMTVSAAHEICDRIEAALKRAMPGVVITIHVEPDVKVKHEGIVLT